MVMFHHFWVLPHGLYQQNKNETTGEMAQKLRACTALAEDHIQVPAPTTGGSQTPVAPASGDLLFHHTHRTENKTNSLKEKEHLSYPSVLTF